jgi:DNA-directed RNA polymerase subunit omega
MSTSSVVEDCLEQIPNRFELCAIASKRARQLVRGADSPLPWMGHRATVQSLAEIASGHVSRAILDDADLPLPEVQSRLAALDIEDFGADLTHAWRDRP